MRIASLPNVPASTPIPSPAPVPRVRPVPLAPLTSATPQANGSAGFDGTRTYVLEQFDSAVGQLNRSVELLSKQIPPGPFEHSSSTYQHINQTIGAVNGAATAAQEGLVWYGELRASSTLPDHATARERAVMAHVFTGLSGVTRADGFMRGLLEVGHAPLNQDQWRDQAVTDALDSITYLKQARELVEAMQPRA